MAHLSVQIETSFAGLAPFREEWNRFVLDVGSDLYMSFDYLRLWWEVFGFGRKLRTFLIREDGRLVGLLPMLIDRIQLGPVWLRVARMLGSDLVREMFIAPVRADKAEEVYSEVISHLFEKDRCDALVWGCYSTLIDTSEAFRKAVAFQSERVTIAKDRTLDFPYVNFLLPSTFEEYLGSLNRHRRDFRRYSRRIQDCGELKLTVRSDAEFAVNDFPEFRDLYDRYNKSKGRPGHFLGDPLRERFWLRLCEELGPRGGIRLVHLSTGERTIGYEYCLKFGRSYHWKYRTRVFGPEWNNLGVGTVGLVELIKKAIEEGMDRIEAGSGHFDYKVEYGATESPIRSILIVANSPRVHYRFRLFEKMVRLLDFVYLKLWIWRLRPRLPIPPKARWNLWFRTRL